MPELNFQIMKQRESNASFIKNLPNFSSKNQAIFEKK